MVEMKGEGDERTTVEQGPVWRGQGRGQLVAEQWFLRRILKISKVDDNKSKNYQARVRHGRGVPGGSAT